MSEDTGQGYAQNDEHLREMEREAYEKGNLCFRDWEDGIKSNLQPGTIYEQRVHRRKNSMSSFQKLNETFKAFLIESDWKAGDEVELVGSVNAGAKGIIQEPMAGHAVIELTEVPADSKYGKEGDLIKVKDDYIEKVGYMSGGEMPVNEAEFVGHHAEIGGKIYVDSNFLNSVRKIRDTFPSEMKHLGFGEFYLETPKGKIDFDRSRGQDFPGMVGRSHQLYAEPPELADELIDAMEQAGASETPQPSEEPPPGLDVQEAGPPSDQERHHQRWGGQEEAHGGASGSFPERYGEGPKSTPEAWADENGLQVEFDNEGQKIIYLDSEQATRLDMPPGVSWDAMETQDGEGGWVIYTGEFQSEKPVAEAFRGSLKEDEGGRFKPSRQGQAGRDYESEITNFQGNQLGAAQRQRDKGQQNREKKRDDEQRRKGMTPAQLCQEMAEDQGADDVEELAVHYATRLFPDMTASVFAKKYGIGTWNTGMTGTFTAGSIAPCVSTIKFMNKFEEYDKGKSDTVNPMTGRLKEGFRGSPEEDEMKKKMSNKEFADYVTKGQFSTPDLKGDMGPVEGMEGPYQYASGAVLYYDPKEGKYYDRGQDRYLDNEEAAQLTMEKKEMKIKDNLRERVLATVMKKLKEEYHYGEFDADADEDEGDPYMTGLEAEFPWLAGGGDDAPRSPEEEAAMAAAAADAAAAGEFGMGLPPGEEEEDPLVMKEEDPELAHAGTEGAKGLPPAVDAEINAETATDPVEIIGSLIHTSGFMNAREPLEQMGFKVDFVTEPITMYILEKDGVKYAALNKKYAEDPDLVVGEIAIGTMAMGEGLRGEKTAMDDKTFAENLKSRVMKRLLELSDEQSDEMDPDGDGDIDKKDLAALRHAKEKEEEGEKKEESLRQRLTKIVREALNEGGSTDSIRDLVMNALQSEGALEDPAGLADVVAGLESALGELMQQQVAGETPVPIRDPSGPASAKDMESWESDYRNETVEGKKYKREPEEEEEEEEKPKKGKGDEPEELYEKHEDEDEEPEKEEEKEEVEERIADNPEDFFRKLRQESRQVGNEAWNKSHKSKRSSMLNEKLMKSWFNK
jgi:hypothetical protein